MNVNKIEISLYDVHKQAIISKKASMGEKKARPNEPDYYLYITCIH